MENETRIRGLERDGKHTGAVPSNGCFLKWLALEIEPLQFLLFTLN